MSTKTCTECKKDFSGSGRKCSACIKRLQRAKNKELSTLPTVDIPMDTKAHLLPVDTSQPFSKQQSDALGLDKRAVHNTRNGRDEWVVPGACKWGPCLNPNCQYHPVNNSNNGKETS